MLLIDGTILNSEEIQHILPTLEKRVCKTLNKPVLDPLLVVDACHMLAIRIEQGDYSSLLSQMITEEHLTLGQLEEVVHMLRRESLLYKLKTELGNDKEDTVLAPPYYIKTPIRRRRLPLGVLLHIAAGNVDGLPAYSVIEGLLAGNINLLKLPAADHDFTIHLLSELIGLEPRLAEYIYVFDTSSNDVTALQSMSKCADAIVVWGGDTAIEAVRRLATPNTKLIEWGHKISFAYITEQGMEDSALTELAHHILSTKQLLCSSSQGIYIDTQDMSVVFAFCERFLKLLDIAAKEYPRPSIGMQAQLSLLLYNQELEAINNGRRIYKGKACSLLAAQDKKLEVSFTYGNCWVKPLPAKNIIGRLHHYKGYLQTVGLLCSPDERALLTDRLLSAGATRITSAGDMSRMLCGESHDGEYPLARYTKIVEYLE